MQAAWEFAADEYVRLAEQAAGCKWDAAKIYARDAATAANPADLALPVDPTSTDTTPVLQGRAGADDAPSKGLEAADAAEPFSLELPPEVSKRMRVEY